MNQRDMMRELFRRYGKTPELVIGKYAEAERVGRVIRKKNSCGLTAHDYAIKLFADGKRRKWIYE